MYEALIFDLDGTLWDTSQPVTQAWNQVARTAEGLPQITESDIRSVMGLAHEEAFHRLLPGVDPEKRERAAREFYQREVQMLHANYLYPGVREGVERLAGQFGLYLVSNCQTEYLQRFLQLSGLGHHFKDSECHGATGLPKGDNIARVMRRNTLTRVAYVGDTAGDQIAARQAGADYYHVSYGFGSPAQECLVFGAFKEVVEFFISLPRP